MNKQIIAARLSAFDLDEVETRLYLGLWEGGPKTPLQLSRETGINRSRIYRYLTRLKDKKLIEESYLGRGLQLKASDPSRLELIIIEQEQKLAVQKESLTELVKELSSLPSRLRYAFEVKHYHGLEGLKQMLWNQLSDKEILLYGYQTRNEIVGKSFADKVREEQVRRRIITYEIENEVDPGDYRYTDVAGWAKFFVPRYVSPKVLEIKQYTAIVGNTVSIMNWTHNQRVGVEVINAHYAAMQRQLFWQVWEKVGVKPKQPKLKT